ncbi:MAG: hypothetical protein IAF38_13595 [Bacteroidia bacterium]|nr:hypothetical protein [Bacteroidia bacterium]
MKTNKLFPGLLVITMLTIASCGSKEPKTDAVSEEATTEVKGKTVNSNLSLTLKDVPAEKLGLSVGVPEGWSVELSGEFGDAISYVVKRGSVEMIYIESGTDKQDDPGLASALEKWDNKEKYEILDKEDKVAANDGKRTGLVVWKKKTDNPAKEIVFDYFLSFTSGKVNYAKVYPTDNTYNFTAVDTCITIVKSIRPGK